MNGEKPCAPFHRTTLDTPNTYMTAHFPSLVHDLNKNMARLNC